jgi:hypothetical protein
MRTTFTIEFPTLDGKEISFPDNKDVLEMVRSFGWEPMEIKALGEDEALKEKKYKEFAENLFKDMPEIANEEKDNVIFYGFIAADQSKFVITRRVEGQVTFRLLHPVLPRLQASTEKIVRKILAGRVDGRPIKIVNQSVLLYERGFDHIIMSGRVIPSPYRETISSDRKDVLLFLGPILLEIPTFYALNFLDPVAHKIFFGTAERVSTALLTTALVSFLGLLQTYLEIRRHHLIAWNLINDARQ